jgi:hypothetical protein
MSLELGIKLWEPEGERPLPSETSAQFAGLAVVSLDRLLQETISSSFSFSKSLTIASVSSAQ